MILIERFIFQRALSSTVIALAGFTLIALLTQIIRRVNLLTQTQEAFGAFLKFAMLMTPTVALVVLPFAVLLGASRTLDTMNADSEMHVIEASGASRWIAGKPIVLLGALFSVVALVSSLYLEPWTSRKLRDVVTQAQTDVIQLAVRSGEFKEISPKLFIQISEQLPGGDFAGIVIADGRDPANDLVYYAKHGSAIMVDDRSVLYLHDGEINKFPSTTEDIRVVTFSDLAFDVAGSGGPGNIIRSAQERTTQDLWSPDPADRLYADRPELMQRELHRRLSEWLYPLGYSLVALYFLGGARSNRTERAWRMVFATVISALLRGASVLLLGAVASGPLGPPLAYAIPVGTTIVFGLMVLRRRPLRRPPAWVESLSMAISDMAERAGDYLVPSRRRAIGRPQ